MHEQVSLTSSSQNKKIVSTAAQKPTDIAAIQSAKERNGHHIVRIQIMLCLFIGAVFFFAAKHRDDTFWLQLSLITKKLLSQGIGFSGREELTRLLEEANGLWNGVAAYLSLP